ncbi:TDP-N-acetylfucosamine:lipid II N-acetylfucosaminyltransferase [Aneurinibacillus migulanus]|uniref:TDP-N-acetylfucosamine:lipid II N-acetylfucosaminyltransferase n=1 Tax=Aneurinibacillus migulanus TaxID=47500 RepID=UPI002E1EC825|nr:TDP-N-acetylfucosamine:lipid II N-acetylfucosaminyltransferase [Aneurinibacillus migulanus]MED4730241.1 TDP-N-acetylfucosamine:lipid II N-acetylfucosaminyltransferase [Aneurinibacillus migulanus]
MLQFFDSIKHKKIVIFGAGGGGKKFKEKFSIPVSFYVDNAAEKWDTEFAGSVIKSPEILKQEDKDHLLILIASMYSEQISRQLEQHGFKKDIHFFCASELFINPLNLSMEKVLRKEVKEIGNKISKMLSLGYTEDANVLLREYEEIAPLDNRIQLFYDLVALYNKDKETVGRLKGYIQNSLCNLDVHYNYYCAMCLEENGEYLKALEVYEMVLAQLDNQKLKQKVMGNIYTIESLYFEEIKEQLTIEKTSTFQNDDGNYYLHLMFDNFYSKTFIEFINENFNSSEHVYLIFTWKEKLEHINTAEYSNIKIVDLSKVQWEQHAIEILKWIENSKLVFIHYLFDFYCWLMCRYKISKKIFWVLWGADLYAYIDIPLYDKITRSFLERNNLIEINNQDKNFYQNESFIYRKAAIRKFSRILTFNRGDYELAKEFFVTNAKNSAFFYKNPVDVKIKKMINSKYNFKEEYQHVFLLGNSGTPENNHLEILNSMKRWECNDFCVVVPLSYGDPAYIKKLIHEGKKLLGEKFIPLLDFLAPEEYASILSNIDVAFMNHNRQQGVGNIIALMSLNKKIYMKPQVTTYKFLENNGIKIYDIEYIETFDDVIQFNDIIGLNNKEIIMQLFGDENIKNKFNEVLSL